MIHLTLPYPPTTNNLFMNVGKGRIRTKKYDAWIAEATRHVRQQAPQPITGLYSLTLKVWRPDRRRRDASNLIKAVEDLLVSLGVTPDDCDAGRVSAEWVSAEPRKDAFAYVELTPFTYAEQDAT